MASFKLILVVAFFICEVLAAYGTPARPNLVALGLACFALSLLL